MVTLVRITYIALSKVLAGILGKTLNINNLFRLVSLIRKTTIFEYITEFCILVVYILGALTTLFWLHWIHETLQAWSW